MLGKKAYGYPIVDAGMRELILLAGCTIEKNDSWFILGKTLLINWKDGEKYFRNCLLDYSPANNVAGWQWVEVRRILHPISEYLIQFCKRKIDKEGVYVKNGFQN